MASNDNLPAVVSKRNEFASSRLMVEDAVARLPEQYRSEQFSGWLKDYTDNVIHEVDHAFAVGASNGIEQVSRLLQDPDYYTTLKDRRKRELQRHRDYAAKQEQENRERQLCPTQQQIDERIDNLQKWIADYEKSVERMQGELEQLKALNPKHVRFPGPKK